MSAAEQTVKPGQSLLAMTAEAAQLETALMAHAEAHLGEISPELERMLEEVEAKLAVKADSYKYLLDRLKYSAEMLWGQAESFDRAAKQLDMAQERLRDRIKQVMIMRETQEVNGVNWRWRLQAAAPKLEVDLDQLPHELKIEKVTYAPNRELINELLRAGKEVPGVKVVPVTTLRSYVRKSD